MRKGFVKGGGDNATYIQGFVAHFVLDVIFPPRSYQAREPKLRQKLFAGVVGKNGELRPWYTAIGLLQALLELKEVSI
jgi:hypothetical protein